MLSPNETKSAQDPKEILIVGDSYPQSERDDFEATFTCRFIDTPNDINTLPAPVRNAIEVVALRGHADFSASHMNNLPLLKLISNYGVGYDAVDVTAASQRDIKVTNTPDVLTDDVADLALGLMLAQSRNLVSGDALVRSGSWADGEAFPLNRKFSGSSVGIVGLGRIGHAIAERLIPFQIDIHYHARSEKQTPGWTFHKDVQKLAQAVDFLVVALVGGPETQNYIGASTLEALGPRGVLINISRGSVVDEAALIAALHDNQIAGAGLDVFNNEPHVDPRFYDLKTVTLQPHQGSGTYETRAEMAKLQRGNISALLNGLPLITAVN